MKIKFLYFIIILLILNSCIPGIIYLNNINKLIKPRKISYHKSSDTLSNHKLCAKKYAYFRVIDDNYVYIDYIYFYNDKFIHVNAPMNNILKSVNYIPNSTDSVKKTIEFFYENFKGWYDKSLADWGFYKTSNDSIYMQYLMYVGPIIPSSVRVAEIRGRIMPDSSIVIDREIYNGSFDATYHIYIDNTYNPPIKFKRFEVDFLPDYKKSGVYKSVWYKRYMRKSKKKVS